MDMKRLGINFIISPSYICVYRRPWLKLAQPVEIQSMQLVPAIFVVQNLLIILLLTQTREPVQRRT
jgi:hypothetical protein